MRGNTSENTLGSKKDVIAQIISSHTFWVGDWVDFSKGLNNFGPPLVVFGMVNYNSTSALFSLLDCCQFFFIFNCLRYETSGVSLDQHQLKNINLLISYPSMIKFLEITPHVFENILNCDVYFFHDSFINISNDLLNHLELLEKFSSSFQNILRENVFFSINPKVWKAFLSRVKDLS